MHDLAYSEETTGLSDQFLNSLVTELDNDDIVGIILGGSHARGEATPYSDVDIACFVPDTMKPPPKRFTYRDGRLVSIGTKTAASIRSDLARPERAIFIAHAMRRHVLRVLLDKDGSISNLVQEVDAFTWEPLQAAADIYASFGIMLFAEMAHKILSELLKGDALAISYATSKLFSDLTEIVAVQRGVLIKTDSTYYRQVQEAVGLNSHWTRYHRFIAGVDERLGDVSPLEVRAVATLNLYQETAKLFRPSLHSSHREVIEQTVLVIDEALNKLHLEKRKS